MAGGKKGKTAAKSDSAPAAGGKGKGKGGKQDSTQAGKTAPAKNKAAQKIDVCHILCDKFSQREEAHDKIKSGELTWSAACEAYSTEKARSGGKIGVKMKGQLEPEFEEEAFKLLSFKEHPGNNGKDADYTYGKCKTVHGYHLILVRDKS